MPYVQVTTREPISQETKVALAKALSDAVLTIEIGGPTEGGKDVDWMWFNVQPAEDWAVGGEFSSKYVRGRLICQAVVIAPKWLMNRELQLKAIAEVTRILREQLSVDPEDDGTGIFVFIVEVPLMKWGLSGGNITLPQLIEHMNGDVSPERRAEMKANSEGLDRLRESFGNQD